MSILAFPPSIEPPSRFIDSDALDEAFEHGLILGRDFERPDPPAEYSDVELSAFWAGVDSGRRVRAEQLADAFGRDWAHAERIEVLGHHAYASEGR